MNNLKNLTLAVVALFGLSLAASAQTTLNQTTLSGAITTTQQRVFQVASGANITAPSLTSGTSTQLYIDDEVLDVTSVNGNFVTARRGVNGTKARTHASGANVYIAPANLGALIDYSLGGSCISGSYPATPMIDYYDGQTYTCQNGQWEISTVQGSQHLPTSVFTTSAYTNATSTFSNISAFAFPVSANHSYTMTCQLAFQGSATTAGPKFQVTGPASPTTVLLSVDGATGAAAYGDGVATAFSSSVAALGTLAAGATNYTAHVVVSVINGLNAGTVNLQAAANGAGTLTIQPGSYCIQQ